jgi:putative phage-type endonuclease
MTLTVEQKAQRAKGISASEVAVVCGLSPYGGPWTLWAVKQGLLAVEETEEMALGHLIEPVIASVYQRRNPEFVLTESLTLAHPTEPWALATPDRIVTCPDGSRHLLECKSGGPQAAKRWGAEEDAVPPEYLVQAMWQLYVTGLDRCDVVGYVGGEMRFHCIRRNDAIIAALVSKCRAWWERHVRDGEEPGMDAILSTGEALAMVYPEVTGPLREANADEETLLIEYLAAVERRGVAEDEVTLIANRLKAVIADDEGIAGGKARATWKAPKGQTVQWKAVAEAMNAPPAVIAAHSAPYGRRLDVRATKEKTR